MFNFEKVVEVYAYVALISLLPKFGSIIVQDVTLVALQRIIRLAMVWL